MIAYSSANDSSLTIDFELLMLLVKLIKLEASAFIIKQ